MTTNRILAVLFAAFALVLGAPGIAAATETVTCPAVFPMKALQLTQATDGWAAQPGERAPRLIGFGLYSGTPAQLAQLQETSVSKGQAIWQLSPPYPEGLWVQCVYADGALTLTRRLTITSGVCSAPSALPIKGKAQPASFVCK